MTVYLLEIMGFGLLLFMIALFTKGQRAATLASGDRGRYSVELDDGERAFLEVTVKRAKTGSPADASLQSTPSKATAK